MDWAEIYSLLGPFTNWAEINAWINLGRWI
jgi:hypothetical protein